MATSAQIPRPTESELAILSVLWQRGPSTVREVLDEMNGERSSSEKPIGYTTILKFLQIMTEKRLVVRDDAQRTHIYRPAPGATEQPMQRRLVKDLADRAFGGSMR